MSYSGARPKCITLAGFGVNAPLRCLTMATFGFIEHQPDFML